MFKTWLIEKKEFLVTGGVVLAGLALMTLLPASEKLNGTVQGAILTTAVFLVLPLLYCKMVLRQTLATLGFRTGSILSGIIGSLVAVISGLVFLFGLMYFTPLFEGARLPAAVEENFLIFLLYEVLLNGWITLMLEVFFRGFIMLLWLRSFGFFSVLLQAGIFIGLSFGTGDITPQLIPFLLFSPLAGLVAYQSRSIVASWGASWFFVFLADIIFLLVR